MHYCQFKQYKREWSIVTNEELQFCCKWLSVYHGVCRDVGLVYCVSFLAPDFLQDLGKLLARQIQGGFMYVRFKVSGWKGQWAVMRHCLVIHLLKTTVCAFLGACTLSTRRALIWKSPTVFWERLRRNLVFYARALLA